MTFVSGRLFLVSASTLPSSIRLWAPRQCHVIPFSGLTRNKGPFQTSSGATAFNSFSTSLPAAKPSAPNNNNNNNKTRDDTLPPGNTAAASTKTYTLSGRGAPGGTRVEITTGTGHSIATDVPKTMGGGDTAPQPVETLLAAWMGCTQATASFVGRQLLRERRDDAPRRGRAPEVRLAFEGIEAVRDERGALDLPIRKTPTIPSRLQKITGTVRVSLVPAARGGGGGTEPAIILDPEDFRVLQEQTEARCPVANMMLESGCAMEVEWMQEEA